MDTLLQDLRYALRNLRQSPLFTGVAVLTLAFGIGVNATLFTLVDSLLWRPLPLEAPEELVEVYSAVPSSNAPYTTSSYLDYLDLREQNEVFTDLAGHSKMIAQLTHGGRSEFIVGELVTGNYFEVLGVRTALGRTLEPSDDLRGEGAAVAVLGHRFWQKRLGADPSVVGTTLRLNGTAYSVVGVMNEDFGGTVAGVASDLWIPATRVVDVEPAGMIQLQGSQTGGSKLEHRGWRWMFLTGRLQPRVPLEQAGAQLQTIASRLAQEYPDFNKGRELTLVPTEEVRLHPSIDQALQPVAAVLFGVVALVLLIASANLANMVLSRATARRREVAIRLALGADRLRLLRQFLTESLVLSLLGGTLALLVSAWTTRLILAFQPPVDFSLSLDLRFDERLVFFTLALSFVTALLFGLLPALQASRPALVPALKDGGGGGGGERRFGLRQALVVVQVAVSLVLLVGAGLLARGLLAAHRVDVGFAPERVAVLWMHPGLLGHDKEQVEAFYRQLLENARELPGVESASLTSRLPFTLNEHRAKLFIDGHQRTPEDAGYTIDSADVEPGYFATLGLELVAGRDVALTDTEDRGRVAIVNETLARRFWPEGEAIGSSFRLVNSTGPAVEIIGVVRDHKVSSVMETSTPMVHFARQQRRHDSAHLVARAAPGVSAAGLLPALQRTALALEPDLPVASVTTLAGNLDVKLFPARAGAQLLSLFGALALLLASLGLYGVIAYSVSRRSREIGLRIALGAQPGDVKGMVVRQGMILVALGIAVGALAAAAAGRMLTAVLYGVSAADPLAFGLAITLLTTVALTANYLPARRAARVDPLEVLRQD